LAAIASKRVSPTKMRAITLRLPARATCRVPCARLFQLALWIGVGHDAGTGAEAHVSPFDFGTADEDVEVESPSRFNHPIAPV
jgi:hypothetical protein